MDACERLVFAGIIRAVHSKLIADLGNKTFADWLLAAGEDWLEKLDEDRIRCPDAMVINPLSLDGLINSIYPGFADAVMYPRVYFSRRAILAARNDNVANVNMAVLNMIPGRTYEFLSADKVDDEEDANVNPTKYLNRLDINGWPPHRLQPKVRSPIMLLRNLDASSGLCNGTRLIVGRCCLKLKVWWELTLITCTDRANFRAIRSSIRRPAEAASRALGLRNDNNKSQGQTLQLLKFLCYHFMFDYPKLMLKLLQQVLCY